MRKNFRYTSVSFVLLLSLNLLIPSRLGFGTTPVRTGVGTGELSAYGEVNINGDPSATGTALFSGSVVATGSNSTAVISLGELGRIELLPITKLKLEFGENAITCELTAGTARMSAAKGVTVTLSTKDGLVSSDPRELSMFAVTVTDSTSFSRFAGILKPKDGSNFDERSPGNFFRPAVVDAMPFHRKDQGARVSTPPSAFAEKIAVLLIGIGAVFAAVTGLNSTRDASFFRIGGSSAVSPGDS